MPRSRRWSAFFRSVSSPASAAASAVPIARSNVDRPGSWSELNEMLFAGSWNPDLQRFRSPFAFRGLASTTHHLSNSLLRLAAGQASINTLELSLLRNFSKYAHAQPAPGIESVWHWLALGQHHGLPT